MVRNKPPDSGCFKRWVMVHFLLNPGVGYFLFLQCESKETNQRILLSQIRQLFSMNLKAKLPINPCDCEICCGSNLPCLVGLNFFCGARRQGHRLLDQLLDCLPRTKAFQSEGNYILAMPICSPAPLSVEWRFKGLVIDPRWCHKLQCSCFFHCFYDSKIYWVSQRVWIACLQCRAHKNKAHFYTQCSLVSRCAGLPLSLPPCSPAISGGGIKEYSQVDH